MQQTEKYWNLINRIVLVAIVIMAGVGVVLAFTPKVRQMKGYQSTLDDLQQRIATTETNGKKTRENIQRFKNDPKFVEKVAHEVGYARTNETIFHFSEETGSNEF
ncbi:MAG: septum formation initiator family protein [Kiritimatiellaceae bacterium]|nr:septum formation initiator family protein [Kiritimatiellaceae bacterium]